MEKSVRVLLVEDSEDDATLLIRTLKGAGYEVMFERVETKEAMQTALDNQKWDIVISDYNLPKFDGLRALKLLQKKGIDLPFILVSGNIGEEIAVNAMKAGANDYVMKHNLTRLPLAVEREIREIAERKYADAALRESEERHRNLVNFSPYGIAIHSEGKIVFMNTAGANVLGSSSPEKFNGKNVLDIIHPDYHDIARERIHMVEMGKTALPIEEVFVRVDGTFVDVEVTSIPFIYDSKPAMYGVFMDITERKRNEKMRLENIRLEEADKAKSEFLSSMSHELRTPLSAAIGFSELLKMSQAGELNEKQKHYVDNILESNKFLLTLINDILDLSKIEAGKIELVIEKISVPVTIKETLSLIKEKAYKNNVLMNTEFNPQLEFIDADKQRFKQVIFNLLSNAVKFTPKDGTVTIRTKKIGSMALISVSDTGIGIKEENIGKLFQKFEQLEPGISQKYGGTGLGLAITKQLVEMHGGKIWAESTHGEGSTFTFSIPLEAKKMQEVKEQDED